MNRLCLPVLCVLAVASASAAAPITIDHGAYTGRYFVANEEFVNESATLDLADGTYSLDTGAGSAGSSFAFTVAGGAVVSVSNAEAAQFTATTIALQTAPVTINAGTYGGRYFVSAFDVSAGGFSGTQTLSLVPGLEYSIDDGAEVAGSSFLFTLAGGTVSNISPAAATAAGSTLSFNTATINVDPARYAGLYYLTSNLTGQYFTGPQSVTLITSLVYGVDNFSTLGGSAFYFALDATGQVTTTSQAATAGGGTLTFLNVLVAVDPGGYPGVYRVGGYTSLSGPTLVTLIPTLLTTIAAESQATAMTPGFTAVTPSSATLVLSGQPYTFTFNAITVGALSAQVNTLPLSAGLKNSLLAKLQGAQKQIQRGNTTTAASQLTAFVSELTALEQSGGLAPLYADFLIAEAQAIISHL